MSLNLIQKQLNKTYTVNNVQKTSKTLITILGDFDIATGIGTGIAIDSNRLLRDPTLITHIARWAGYKVIDKTIDTSVADAKSQIDWKELKVIQGETPWADLGRAEKWAICQKKLEWVLAHFDFELGETGKYLSGVKLTNASLGNEGFMGEEDKPGTVKSPLNGEDFMTYLKKVYRGGSKVTVTYGE